ncbi:MAG TPA: ABC transporter substrate-binding protein [Negativicutes bacterium]|nr:ABC transporter substrate-binding protein [Negativicutes bacterium]
MIGKKLGVFSVVALIAFAAAIFAGCGGGASQEIVIGNLQDMSGPTSVWGNAVTRGAEVAVEMLNAKGGIDGKKIKLVTLDTKGDVQEAIKAYNRLADQDKAIAVLGPPVSNIGLALAPIANTKKVPIVGSFIDPRVTVGQDGKPQAAMFLMQPSSVQYAEIMASYAVEKLALKKIAIFYDQSNAFSVSLIAPFKAYAQSVGAKIVAEEVYGKGDKDFKTQLSKIKDSGADSLYVPNYIQDLVITLKQAKQVGLKIPIIGGLDFAPPFANLVNDPEAVTNCFFANNFSDTEPQLQEVKKAYVAKYKEDPVNKVYLGYDKILIIAEAVKKAGSTKPEDVIKGLNQISGLQGTTGVITLSPNTHQPVGLSMVMYKIDNGKYVDLGRYVPEKHKK